MQALPFAYAKLDYVAGRNRHGADLKPGDRFTLNIDGEQMGVGGDNSWGFWPLDAYRLPLHEYDYRFRLVGISAGDVPERFSRLRLTR